MQTNSRSTTSRDDTRSLSTTIRKLLLPTRLLQAGVIAAVVIIWVWIAQQILRLGGMIRYDGLKSLGPEFVRIMTDINPYLWWGVVAILSLIVLSVTRTWLINSQKRSRTVLVPVADVQRLANTLSVEGIQVLRWVWDESADPVTVGDLITTRQQLGSGRVRKLAMAQAQALALASASKPPSFNMRDADTPQTRPEPVIDSRATESGERKDPPTIRAEPRTRSEPSL
ncbi:hypothetical protein [Orrella marina]|uniref:Uncharacterized protein n=1 Tax=Orrella marina TaxID=2163011 RepID=A0A2R4XM30_9BURK|nr:hypothetical protein [Orrella marina]AWB34799.1 hypothetical protein DBV39_14905 [Orrella marina]